MVLDARRISPTTATNALTIKDTPERIAAAARVISAIDKARPEVIIDVELLEVDRTRLQEYGLQIASPGTAHRHQRHGVHRRRTPAARSASRALTQPDLSRTCCFPACRRSITGCSRPTPIPASLANPQLRTADGMPAQAGFGEQVPVPVTTFAPIATGGQPQQPITSFNYQNIGVNIDITPRTHHDDDVSLDAEDRA